MSDFTEGPWRIGFNDNSGSEEGAYWITDGVEAVVVGGDHFGAKTGVQKRADAILITAAPDMLEALRSAKDLADVMEKLASGRSDDEWVWEAQAKINAAIAKAEGR